MPTGAGAVAAPVGAAELAALLEALLEAALLEAALLDALLLEAAVVAAAVGAVVAACAAAGAVGAPAGALVDGGGAAHAASETRAIISNGTISCNRLGDEGIIHLLSIPRVRIGIPVRHETRQVNPHVSLSIGRRIKVDVPASICLRSILLPNHRLAALRYPGFRLKPFQLGLRWGQDVILLK